MFFYLTKELKIQQDSAITSECICKTAVDSGGGAAAAAEFISTSFSLSSQ